METAWTALVALALSVWLTASVVNQLPPRWWNRVAGYDRLRMLPQWHFFAPRPGRRDHHLVYRDFVAGQPGRWRELDLGEARLSSRWLWNPYRFRQKAQTDLINGLLKARRLYADNGAGPRSELLSLPYLGLLSWVTSQPTDPEPCLRQFAVLSSYGHGPDRTLRVTYVSPVHSVQGNSNAG